MLGTGQNVSADEDTDMLGGLAQYEELLKKVEEPSAEEMATEEKYSEFMEEFFSEIDYEKPCNDTQIYPPQSESESAGPKPEDHTFSGLKDCDIMASEEDKEEANAQAEAYFNQIAAYHAEVKEELKPLKENVGKAKKMLKYCVGTKELDVTAPFTSTLDEISTEVASCVALSASYYYGSNMFSAKLDVMYSQAESAHCELNHFKYKKASLEDDLAYILALCDAQVCLFPEEKDHLEGELDDLLNALELSEGKIYNNGVSALKHFGQLKGHIKAMEENPSMCDPTKESPNPGDSEFSVSLLFEEDEGIEEETEEATEGDEDTGPTLGELRSGDLADRFGKVKKIEVRGAEGAEFSVEERTFVVEKGDQRFEFEKDDIDKLSAQNREEVEKIEVDFEDEKPVYKVQRSVPVKLFGIMPMRLKATSVRDAETLEQRREEKPWWAFLTTRS